MKIVSIFKSLLLFNAAVIVTKVCLDVINNSQINQLDKLLLRRNAL